MTAMGREQAGSPERFGYQWGEYSELRPEYEAQFRAWTAPLAAEDWRGRDFLDVGCGMGRNSHWPMTYGARSGVAIDLDDRSLAAARRALAPWPALEVQAMSVYEIAFENAFDVVFSIGVIHHLAEPERALRQMAKAARPGGRVLIWVYGHENNEWIVRYFDPLRRLLFARLPIGLTHALSLAPTAGLWLFLRLGLGRLEYLQRIRSYPFRRLRNIVFDQMLPRIAHYWRRDEVAALMRAAGLSDISVVAVNGMSWAAIGSKAGEVPG
jgi:SAM-dependent methyltransferase